MLEELNWHGFDFLEVAPDYTSKACPVCSNIDDKNRDGKEFKCTCCGYKDDADHVGGINIGNRADDQEPTYVRSTNTIIGKCRQNSNLFMQNEMSNIGKNIN